MDKGLFVPLIGASIFFILIILESTDGDPFSVEIDKQIKLTKLVDVDKENIFEIMSSPELYPKVLPEIVVEVKIINQTGNVIFAEETISELGLRKKMLVKHELFPFDKHIIEILDGDANGTKVVILFSEVDSKTTISSDLHLKVSGPLVPFLGLIHQGNFERAYVTVINAFVKYIT